MNIDCQSLIQNFLPFPDVDLSVLGGLELRVVGRADDLLVELVFVGLAHLRLDAERVPTLLVRHGEELQRDFGLALRMLSDLFLIKIV